MNKTLNAILLNTVRTVCAFTGIGLAVAVSEHKQIRDWWRKADVPCDCPPVNALPDRSVSLVFSSNWTDAQHRHESIMANPKNKAAFEQWLSQLDGYKNASIADKMSVVDAAVDNCIIYEDDSVTYGRIEYYASPMESLTNGQGDCEDYAILKFHALLYLGVPPDHFAFVASKIVGEDEFGHSFVLADTTTGPGDLLRNRPVILNNNNDCLGTLEPFDSTKYKILFTASAQPCTPITPPLAPPPVQNRIKPAFMPREPR